ncbi:MAG: SdrD B-like domain-containing protein, partial [Saprospiraceae bacterium]
VSVTFEIIDDETPEDTEPFFVNLSNPTNGTIANPSGIVTILDSDVPPPVVPNIGINDITVNEEDGTATLEICLDQTTTVNVSVDYVTQDATALEGDDYVSASNTVSIIAGALCTSVTFDIVDDETPEEVEYFLVNLSNPISGTIADPSGTVTIIDSDETPCEDSDEDGICNEEDCAPDNPNLPTFPGTACNDNDDNTIDDAIQDDGCTCAGVAPPCDLTVDLGENMTICNGDNAAITAIVENAAVCLPPNCNTTTLVTYTGDCDDPTECLHASSVAPCLTGVSGICPTEGPIASSCNNDIICIASMFNSWDFSMTAGNTFEFREIEADFWYPTDGSNAGGVGNLSSCPTSYDAEVKFFVDDVLVAEKIVNVDENAILTKVVGPDTPLIIETGSTLRIEIGGSPDSEDCDLFELAGLRVQGCCDAQVPLETNTYSWSGPGTANETSSTIIVAEEGTYCVTVTDCEGCKAIDCVNVKQALFPLAGEINVLNTPASTTASNGVLQVSSSGGTGPYTYSWNNGQTNATINNLEAGDYEVTITDNNGCTTTKSITLNARAIIGDYVWEDVNQNGIQDPTESGLEGILISINGIQNNGNIYTNTTISETNGYYAFDDLAPGDYNITFTPSDDLVGSIQSAGSDTSLDSDADPNTGETGTITVGFNDIIGDIDAGFHMDCSEFEPDFTIPEPICENVMAIFEAYPVGAGAAYSWYFFNGPTTSSTYIGSQAGKSVGMSFTSAGQKLVRLNVVFEGCEFNIDEIITVLPTNDPACSNCNNITAGGQIGTDQSGCAPFNPGDLTNIIAPSGGNGSVEYRWAASITSTTPTGFDDPNWTVIPNADEIVYKPGTINQTTYYVRFSKRSGCDEWTGVSNVVTVEVLGQDITAEFEVLSDPICAGTTIDLAAFDIGENAGYDWYFFNGPSASNTYMGSRNGQEVSFLFTSSGEKLVRLSVVNSTGCSAIVDKIITILEEDHPDCVDNLVQNDFDLRLKLNADDEVVLDWKVNNEPAGAVYEIEHSLDGVDFDIIGSANGDGEKSGNAMLYEYIDDMASFGMNYYRIKQITTDGDFRYSSVKDITISFTDGNKGIVFPNPATDITSLLFSSPLEKTIDFEVVNTQGVVVKRFTMVSGMDRIDLNVATWQTGYYYIYTTEGGYRQLVNKVLKASN